MRAVVQRIPAPPASCHCTFSPTLVASDTARTGGKKHACGPVLAAPCPRMAIILGCVPRLDSPAKVGRPFKTDAVRRRQRAELLGAAVTTIRANGAGTNLADIAAAAGYSKALLYDVFGSKADFAMALSMHVNSRNLTAVFSNPDLAPVQQLRVAIDNFATFVERDPELYRFLVVEARGGTTSLAEQPSMKVVADALTSTSTFDRQLAPIVVQSLVAMVFAAIEVWSLSAAPIPRETLVTQLTEMVLAAYRAAAPN